MKRLFPSTQYKKDYKRYRNNQKKVDELKRVLQILIDEAPIPPELQPHMLHGNYKGCMECHIENDFLLIWVDPDSDIIELVRLGSHSELFGK